jgi:hypothetical protein
MVGHYVKICDEVGPNAAEIDNATGREEVTLIIPKRSVVAYAGLTASGHAWANGAAFTSGGPWYLDDLTTPVVRWTHEHHVELESTPIYEADQEVLNIAAGELKTWAKATVSIAEAVALAVALALTDGAASLALAKLGTTAAKLGVDITRGVEKVITTELINKVKDTLKTVISNHITKSPPRQIQVANWAVEESPESVVLTSNRVTNGWWSRAKGVGVGSQAEHYLDHLPKVPAYDFDNDALVDQDYSSVTHHIGKWSSSRQFYKYRTWHAHEIQVLPLGSVKSWLDANCNSTFKFRLNAVVSDTPVYSVEETFTNPYNGVSYNYIVMSLSGDVQRVVAFYDGSNWFYNLGGM